MRQHEKSWSALIAPSPARITPFPINTLSIKLAANVSNITGRNPPFCSFASLLIVSLIPFISNLDSSMI